MANSVTFPMEYGGSGITITDDADPTTGLDGTGYIDRAEFTKLYAQMKVDARLEAAEEATLERKANTAKRRLKCACRAPEPGANVPRDVPTCASPGPLNLCRCRPGRWPACCWSSSSS